MTGTATVPPLLTARNSMVDMAQHETATVDIQPLEKNAEGQLRVVVLVSNKAGHYLPSGVGSGGSSWRSWCAIPPATFCGPRAAPTHLGAILDGITDQVLASEEPVTFPDVPFQPHCQTIERGDQVQSIRSSWKIRRGT